MLKTLHLFRHGLTDWNTEGRLQGHTDIPLNEEGRRQALTLQTYFTENPVDLFLTSDLKRAQQTAEIANKALKPLSVTALLRESSMGELEGKTRAEAHAQYGLEAWNQWTSVRPEHHDFCFPGAENARKTIARLTSTLHDFCRNNDFKEAGISTHGLVIRRFLHHIAPTLQEPIPVPNCSVYKVFWNPRTELFQFHI